MRFDKIARLLVAVAALALLVGCGMPGDPMVDDMYTKNVYPGHTDTYTIGSEEYTYHHGYFGHLHLYGTDSFRLVDDAKVWIEFRPELDFDIVKKNAVPLSYERGLFSGFELPIWAADDEELFFDICVPDRWDEVSTVHVHINVFVIAVQGVANAAFKLQIAYEHYSVGDIVPNTENILEAEITTGASAAFQSYQVHFDIPVGDIESDDILAFRLRRIAVVVGAEIVGNIVIDHAGVLFLCDKLGSVIAD